MIQGLKIVAAGALMLAAGTVAKADTITEWVDSWLDTIRATGGPPCPIARNQAVVFVSVYEAVNSIVHGNAGGPAANVVVPVVTFTVVASLGVIVPVAFAMLSSSSDDVIARGREWLLARWPTVLFWMLVVVGSYLVAKGVYLLVT